MGNVWMRIVLGLSIAGGSLAMANSASATVWRNRADERYCLSAGNGSMNPGTGLVIRGCNTDLGYPVGDQDWGQVAAPFNSNFVELFNTQAPAPPPFGDNTSPRCTGPSGGDYLNGWQLILWTCNSAGQSHDQGWHPFAQPNDNTIDSSHPSGHQCFSFTNEAAQENTAYWPRLNQVFGVSKGNMVSGTPVIMWQYFMDSSGHATHLDQVWCAY